MGTGASTTPVFDGTNRARVSAPPERTRGATSGCTRGTSGSGTKDVNIPGGYVARDSSDDQNPAIRGQPARSLVVEDERTWERAHLSNDGKV